MTGILSHSSARAMHLAWIRMSLPPSSIPRSCSERYQHRTEKNQMIEARKERVRELIRSLKSVKVRSRALSDESTAFKDRSFSSTKTGAGKSRKMQPIFRAKTGTTSKAPSVT